MSSADIDGYSTHQVPLISAVLQTEGPVIEFGVGNYSTPILHELCRDRELVSIDADDDWLDQFRYMECGSHRIVKVEPTDWSSTDGFTCAKRWGVVLIDHGCDLHWRVREIRRQKDNADFIVVHDSNVAAYGYEEVIPEFQFCYEYTPHILHTLVLSNVRPFALSTPTKPKVR